MHQKVDILLITPPFVQWNCPYPATTVLCSYLRSLEVNAIQADLSIELLNKLFSKDGLENIFSTSPSEKHSKNSWYVYAERQQYIDTIDYVIEFLQTAEQSMAYRIASGTMLPEPYKQFKQEDIEWAFGSTGITEKARYMATMYIEELGLYIQEVISDDFGFNRYAESVMNMALRFELVATWLDKEDTIIDETLYKLLEEKIDSCDPPIIGFTIPFPGNLISTIKASRYIREHHPNIKIVWGGGYVSTELREMTTTDVFKYADYICLDDGELPLVSVLSHISEKSTLESLVRTYCLVDGKLFFSPGKADDNLPYKELKTPYYTGLPIGKYLSIIELTNPMHKLWSDGFWNKLVLAHGCYWAKCTFCDTKLDYICRYDPDTAKNIVDKIENIIIQTGKRGFHFADEAAPPKLLKEVAEELIKRNVQISWWTNIRFEKAFSNELCFLLAKSGCIAMSGGLEVASERILKLINKGVTIEQARNATRNMTNNGIMVHAYLMYGFPSQTEKETIDSLNVVRSMFEEGLLQSAFWHKFTLTVHSDIYTKQNEFGIKVNKLLPFNFALNGVEHKDLSGINHERFAKGLRVAVYNYMHGTGFDIPVKKWFAD